MVYICIIVTEDSVTAMAIKLRQLQLQQEKKMEPRLHIISKRGHNQNMFNRMVSITYTCTVRDIA